MVHTHGTHVNKKVAQGASTRATLIETGRALFGARGFADTSIEDIVAAAGVTKGAFYHHFSGKEDLFREVFEQTEREISERVAPTFVEPEPWDALVEGCLATLDAHLDPAARRITRLDARAVLGWEVARGIESRYGAVQLRGALRQSMHHGVIERLPLGPLAQMLHGALTEAGFAIADAPDADAARREVGELIVRVLDGLRPRT
jgi:AcrR family transcriptional regulator